MSARRRGDWYLRMQDRGTAHKDAREGSELDRACWAPGERGPKAVGRAAEERSPEAVW